MSTLKDILRAVLPEYTAISDAPAWCDCRGEHRRYKAIDGLGNVYLVVNPACWDHKPGDERGRATYFRPAPKLMLTAAQAKLQGGVGGRDSLRDMFDR